ncbi:hypothetical protein [Dehalococcoides mccartyi]|uniref:hypothetical protein n=1 Tax=Dehalococcoides mccartyi TaxID=61435 RepID=UPI002FC8FDCD
MTIDEVSVIMNGLVAIGTLALAAITAYSLLRLEISTRNEKKQRILREIYTILNNVLYYYDNLNSHLAKLRKHLGAQVDLSDVLSNADNTKVSLKLDTLAREIIHDINNLLANSEDSFKKYSYLDALLRNFCISNSEFIKRKTEYLELNTEMDIKFELGTPRYFKWVDSMRNLRDVCIGIEQTGLSGLVV